jgi:hypothetical protein
VPPLPNLYTASILAPEGFQSTTPACVGAQGCAHVYSVPASATACSNPFLTQTLTKDGQMWEQALQLVQEHAGRQVRHALSCYEQTWQCVRESILNQSLHMSAPHMDRIKVLQILDSC